MPLVVQYRTAKKGKMMNFEKLSDIICYYQDYHLTKNKYRYRLAALASFDDVPLSKLKKPMSKSGQLNANLLFQMLQSIVRLVLHVLLLIQQQVIMK